MIELKKIREDIKWMESLEINGGPLHIIVEDGNINDSCIEYCINILHKNDIDYWRENTDCTDEDYDRMLKLAESLLGLPEHYREMVNNGNTITEECCEALYLVEQMEKVIKIALSEGKLDFGAEIGTLILAHIADKEGFEIKEKSPIILAS